MSVAEVERNTTEAGSASGFWVYRSRAAERWERRRSTISGLAPEVGSEMVHDLWMLQVVEEVGLTRASDLEPAHFRFLALIEGDVPDESAGEGMDPPAAWADLQPNEYPTCRRVERATYTVLLDVEGERWSKIVEADNWVDAERQVLSYFADSGYHPGTEILIGATLFGAHGCWEPEDYRFTTYNGLPWKAC